MASPSSPVTSRSIGHDLLGCYLVSGHFFIDRRLWLPENNRQEQERRQRQSISSSLLPSCDRCERLQRLVWADLRHGDQSKNINQIRPDSKVNLRQVVMPALAKLPTSNALSADLVQARVSGRDMTGRASLGSRYAVQDRWWGRCHRLVTLRAEALQPELTVHR